MLPNAYNNGEEKGAAASGAAGSQAQAPKLRSGAHYSMWRPDMEVYLERHGANSVHTREMTAKDWQSLSEQVRQWDEEALTAALLLVTKGSSAAAAASNNTFSAFGCTFAGARNATLIVSEAHISVHHADVQLRREDFLKPPGDAGC